MVLHGASHAALLWQASRHDEVAWQCPMRCPSPHNLLCQFASKASTALPRARSARRLEDENILLSFPIHYLIKLRTRLHNDDSYALGTNILGCASQDMSIRNATCNCKAASFPILHRAHTCRVADLHCLSSELLRAFHGARKLKQKRRLQIMMHTGMTLAMLTCSSESRQNALFKSCPLTIQHLHNRLARTSLLSTAYETFCADLSVRYPLLAKHDLHLSSCGAELPYHFRAVVGSDLTSATSRMWIPQDPCPAAQLPCSSQT